MSACSPAGTAVITDAGRTGSIESVAGLDPEIEIRKLTTLVHEYSKEAWARLELQGVVIEIGDDGQGRVHRKAPRKLRRPSTFGAGGDPVTPGLGGRIPDGDGAPRGHPAFALYGTAQDRLQSAAAVMKWQEILRNSVTEDTIKASTLQEDPPPQDLPYWDRATFLGRISHRLKFANYDGGLVKYDNRIYYVNRSQIEALRPWIRWDVRKMITVIED